MKNASTKSSIIAIILLIAFCSCGNNKAPEEGQTENPIYEQYYYLDVVGDSALDTLVVRSNPDAPEIRDIILIRSDVVQRLVSIRPLLFDGLAVLTEPQIETIHLESNYTQSDQKELRIIMRNTDVMPDCRIIDLRIDSLLQSYVARCYLCNTNVDAPVFIQSRIINRLVINEFGEDRVIYQNLFIENYFKDFLTTRINK